MQYAIYVCMCAKSLQSYLTLCDPIDCSSPGFSVAGISQARMLEWIAMSSSRGSSGPRDGTHISYIPCIGRWVLYQERHPGSMLYMCDYIWMEIIYFIIYRHKIHIILLPIKYVYR